MILTTFPTSDHTGTDQILRYFRRARGVGTEFVKFRHLLAEVTENHEAAIYLPCLTRDTVAITATKDHPWLDSSLTWFLGSPLLSANDERVRDAILVSKAMRGQSVPKQEAVHSLFVASFQAGSIMPIKDERELNRVAKEPLHNCILGFDTVIIIAHDEHYTMYRIGETLGTFVGRVATLVKDLPILGFPIVLVILDVRNCQLHATGEVGLLMRSRGEDVLVDLQAVRINACIAVVEIHTASRPAWLKAMLSPPICKISDLRGRLAIASRSNCVCETVVINGIRSLMFLRNFGTSVILKKKNRCFFFGRPRLEERSDLDVLKKVLLGSHDIALDIPEVSVLEITWWQVGHRSRQGRIGDGLLTARHDYVVLVLASSGHELKKLFGRASLS